MELSLDLNKRYTYADYLQWFDDVRRELVDGFIKLMSGPRTAHQRNSRELSYVLNNIIKRHKGKCQVFYAPFDVRLPANGNREHKAVDTVVQPDICIICDPGKIDLRGCCGAPDFIAEILSPASTEYDTTTKLRLYERVGVREYWVVAPDEYVDAYILQADGKYSEAKRYVYGRIPVMVLENEEIDLAEIFIEI
jgi:Uma2 family endonuclease